MTTAPAPTRLARKPAAHNADWHTRSLCRQTDPEAFFQDDTETQQRAQAVCRGCLVKPSCLTDVLGYENTRDGRFGVVGGLTPVQRRALRVEALLGNRPNLRQAQVLASPAWAAFMHRVEKLPADVVAVELRKLGVIAMPVTVRVALWWCGGKGSLLRPPRPGDRRQLWERVRDEAQDIARRLREMELSRRDMAAYLGVSEDALGRATTAWNRTAEAVAA